jgi:hypothetical protein
VNLFGLLNSGKIKQKITGVLCTVKLNNFNSVKLDACKTKQKFTGVMMLTAGKIKRWWTEIVD